MLSNEVKVTVQYLFSWLCICIYLYLYMMQIKILLPILITIFTVEKAANYLVMPTLTLVRIFYISVHLTAASMTAQQRLLQEQLMLDTTANCRLNRHSWRLKILLIVLNLHAMPWPY